MEVLFESRNRQVHRQIDANNLHGETPITKLA